MRIVLASVAGVLVATSVAWAQGGKPDQNPDWIKKPTAEGMATVYPLRAAKEGKDGSATLDCAVTTEGYLDRCKVAAETPAGYGFGEAALTLASQFAMKPKVRDGRAVEGHVRIPVHWQGMAWMAGRPDPSSRLLTELPWSKTPTAAQVAAAYPKHAQGPGQAALRCGFNKAGGLTACEVISEQPKLKGFGNAARKLALDFSMTVAPDEASMVKTVQVDIPFRFHDPAAPDDGRLSNVSWTRTLSPEGGAALFPQAARAAGAATGVGAVDCAATADGGLTDCRVTREEPTGLGFGQAALEAAKLMKMNPWTRSGEPVDGRRLTAPIRFTLAPAPGAAGGPRP